MLPAFPFLLENTPRLRIYANHEHEYEETETIQKYFKFKINHLLMEFDRILDTTGLTCPMPILKLTKEIKKIEVGEILKLISTDPGCQSNVPIWCKRYKHELIESGKEDSKLIFLIKRK